MGQFTTPVATGYKILSEVEAGFVPALPLIPAELMMQVFAFFRHFVCNGADKEALLNIYWDKNNQEYVIDAPEQIVTKISVNSNISEEFNNSRYIHYMDIHSHNIMDAFFSAVDDHDEKATRVYTVIGKLDKCVPDIKTRISNGGKFLDIDPAIVFEHVGAPFPKEWKDKVRFKHQCNIADGIKGSAKNLFEALLAKFAKVGEADAVCDG
jgi:PRTRC genetic system protein A